MNTRSLLRVRPRPARTERRTVLRRARSLVLALCAMAGLLFVSAPSAQAYAPVDIVHTEKVKVGPYNLTVGFSKWPLRANQSLDFTFAPDGGIKGKSGTLSMSLVGQKSGMGGPGGGGGGGMGGQLARHPRKLSVWGLDVQSLSTAGKWNFTFTIKGSQGTGTGTLKNITVLSQPGPPYAVSWTASTLPPVGGLITLLVVAWRRHRPGRDLAALSY
ncbi:hypothetical protein ACQEWB_10320 [Streptomyces sp. CA-249302]|uniref:hypothetical protein n=1 Tax=Streptomyces sp. CA-249302 TaxID=3240058 RepID=UPI003D8E6007